MVDRVEAHARLHLMGLLFRHFGHRVDKVQAWLRSPNPLLGQVRPDEMLAMGRAEKLLQMVRTQLRENER